MRPYSNNIGICAPIAIAYGRAIDFQSTEPLADDEDRGSEGLTSGEVVAIVLFGLKSCHSPRRMIAVVVHSVFPKKDGLSWDRYYLGIKGVSKEETTDASSF